MCDIPQNVTEHEFDSLKVTIWSALIINLPVLSVLKNLQWLVTLLWLWWGTTLCLMSCGNSFPVRWRTTSILSSCSHPHRHWVSWSLD